MAKPLKILFAVLGALLLLLVAAVVALPLLFDPNDYRDRIAAAVKQETGRDFAVGDIRLAVFPWLRVELKDLRFGNAEGFGTEPMLTAARVEIGARLMPLLRDKRVEASTVKLEGAVVNLAVDAEGRSNWQDLIKPEDPAAPAQAPLAERLKTLDIEGITLAKVQLGYDNRQSGQRIDMSDLSLKTGRLHQGQPFAVQGQLKLVASDANKASTTAAVEFASEVTLEPNGDIALANPGIKLDATQTGASELAAKLAMQGESLRYAAAAQTVAATPLTIDIENLTLGSDADTALKAKGKLVSSLDYQLASGDARLEKLLLELVVSKAGTQPVVSSFTLSSEALSYAKAAQTLAITPLVLQLQSLVIGAAEKPLLMAKGSIKTQLDSELGKQSHALKALVAELQLGGTAMPGGKVQNIKLATSVLADLAAHQINLGSLQLASFGLNISAAGWRISRLDGDAPQLDGDLAIAPFEPRVLLAALGIAVPQTADAGVLKAASLNTQLSASAKSASLKNLTLKLDDSTLRGDLAVRDFASAAVSFALTADRLDADRYLPPAPRPGASIGADATAAAKADANATELPVDLVNQLNAQGTLEVGSMKLKNLKLAKVRLKLEGTKGATHRQQLAASLYGGTADLALTIAPGARHTVKLALSSINAAPFLKDLIDSDKLSGKGSLILDATTAGRTVGAAKKALDGKLAFNLSDGAVKGFNLGQIMRSGQALLARQVPAAATTESTDFAELRGSGVIADGVIKSDDLTAKNPLLRLEGAGEVNLVNETINYLAKPTLVNTAGGQGGKEMAGLSGIVVPVRISGNLYTPKVSIDWQSALKQQAVTELREKLGVSEELVREKREELRGKAKEAIGKELLKLFGSKPAAPAEPPPADPAPAPAPAP
ncbi:MAG: AsmA family protein [Pseudomonadota bacterium]